MTEFENQFDTRCLCCGRKIAAASSVEAGYGRHCARRLRAAAAAAELPGFGATARQQASELIACGGVVPAPFPGVYRTVSSGGDAYYLTHSAACNCLAGLHGRLCYHVAAVRLVTAAAASHPAAA